MGNLKIIFKGDLRDTETIQKGDREKLHIQKHRKREKKYIVSKDSIRYMFEGLSDILRVNQEHIQKNVTTNKAMVEIFKE